MMVASSLVLVSCAGQSNVRVIDSKNKLPIYEASVVGVNGNVSSSAYLTDVNGLAPEPTLPVGVQALVIKKSGYNTKRVALY